MPGMKFPAAETAVRVRAWKKKERRKRGKTRGTVRESLTRSRMPLTHVNLRFNEETGARGFDLRGER